MNIFLEQGFFNTRAPLFMDIVTLIVSLLPLLIYFAIKFAKNRDYHKHKITQIAIYIISLIVVAFFEIGVRYVGGFKVYMEKSSVNSNYFLVVLTIHIIISILMLIIWSYTIFSSKANTKKHKLLGRLSAFLIGLSALTGIWVYLLLFAF